MKWFFTIALMSSLAQVCLAGNGGEGGWTPDPEPYPQPSTGNVWFNCGQIQGVSVTVLNDLTMVLTDKNGVSQRLPLKSTGGIFNKNYVTPDGQLILKARLSNPHIANARGAILSYCASVNSGGGSGGNDGPWFP